MGKSIEDTLSKMISLHHKEWQRWTPYFGTYRQLTDSEENQYHLDTLYSKTYNYLNQVYNIVIPGTSMLYVLDKIL